MRKYLQGQRRQGLDKVTWKAAITIINLLKITVTIGFSH